MHQAADVFRALVALVANSPQLRELNIRGVFDHSGDADGFLDEFHKAALALKPDLRLPSLQHTDDDNESNEFG
jgi:hypothetical protein